MVTNTPRRNLNKYSQGDTDWSHSDLVDAFDEDSIERGPISNRPNSGNYDDELFYATDQKILWGWDADAGDWTARGGTGTADNPLPEQHTDLLSAGEVDASTYLQNGEEFSAGVDGEDIEPSSVSTDKERIERNKAEADYTIRKVATDQYLANDRHGDVIEQGSLSTVVTAAIEQAGTHAHFHFSATAELTGQDGGTYEVESPIHFTGFDNLHLSAGGRNCTRLRPDPMSDPMVTIGDEDDPITILTVDDFKFADNSGDAPIGVDVYAYENTWRGNEVRGFGNWGQRVNDSTDWSEFSDHWVVDPNGSGMLVKGDSLTRLEFTGCKVDGPRDPSQDGVGLRITTDTQGETAREIVINGGWFKFKNPLHLDSCRNGNVSGALFSPLEGDYALKLGGGGNLVRDVNIAGNNFPSVSNLSNAMVVVGDGAVGKSQFAASNHVRVTDSVQPFAFEDGVSKDVLATRRPSSDTDIEHDSGVVHPWTAWTRVADPNGNDFSVTDMPIGSFGEEVTLAHPQDTSEMTIVHNDGNAEEPFLTEDGNPATLTTFDNAIRFVYTNNGWEEVWRNF